MNLTFDRAAGDRRARPFSLARSAAATIAVLVGAMAGAPAAADQPTYLVSSIQTDALKRYANNGAFIEDLVIGGPLQAPQHGTLDPSGTELYVPQAAGGTSIHRYDVETGAFLGSISDPSFVGLTAVSFAPDGRLLISDFSGARVLAYDLENEVLLGDALEPGHFVTPHEVLFLDDCILVTDWQAGALVEFTLDGSFRRILNNGPRLQGPLGIIPTADGTAVHVVNNFPANVSTFRVSDGQWIGDLVPSGSGLVWPEGIERTPDGSILVASPGSNQIHRFDGDSGRLIQTFNPGSGAQGTVDVLLVPATCPADISNDEVVSFDDVLLVLSAWGDCDFCASDVNYDRTVGFDDLLGVLTAWGACDG